MRWYPPANLSVWEKKLCQKLRRVGRFYAFLRKARTQLFDEAFQARLTGMYTGAHAGTEPAPPAQVAILLLLQGYAKVSDDEAIRRAQMDDAWKMVLDTLGEEDSPVSKGTLQNLRNRLIATGMDQALLARTVDLARATGLFGAKALAGLRLAIDSAPLEGAGRVEDTINLIGHALRDVVRAIAAAQGRSDVAAVAHEVGAPVVAAASTKAALNLEWDAKDASQLALDALLVQVSAVRAYLATQPDVVRYAGAVHTAVDVLERVIAQDTEPCPRTPRPKAPPRNPPPQVSLPPHAAPSNRSAPSSPPPSGSSSPSPSPSSSPPSGSPSPPRSSSPPPSGSSPSRATSSHASRESSPQSSELPSGAASPSPSCSSSPPSLHSPPSSSAPPSLPSVQGLTVSSRRLVWGVANDRLISLSDPEMRHGRKTESQRVDGYKRYIGRDLDEGQLILAVTVLAANIPEHRGADAMRPELAPHGPVTEVHIDRAFLPSELVRDVDEATDGVRAKPYSERVRHGYTKRDFTIDLDNREVTCPAGKVAPIKDDLARFRRADCVPCPQRALCQKSDTSKPRVIQLSPREPLLQKLMRRTATPEGRATLRPRVAVEHGLAHVVFRQGERARYFGARKNEYDLRRSAAIGNLQALDHAERLAAAA